MNGSRSRSALLEFLDYLARKGLMNKTTAGARKAAVNNVLGILDDAEADDVSALNIDSVMTRFSNIHGSKYTPDSLNTYKSRLKSAIDDFLNYMDNPLAFKTGVSGNGRKAGDRTKNASEKNFRTEKTLAGVQPSSERSQTAFASPVIVPIPLRADLTVYIQGLPFDLTTIEANKIANVVRAMANQD